MTADDNESHAGSFGIVSREASMDQELGHAAYRLLGILACHADGRTRETFVGRRRLSRELGVSVREIDYLLTQLVDNDYIRKKPRCHRSGARGSNTYTVAPFPEEMPPLEFIPKDELY